jgi:hypothetical protein
MQALLDYALTVMPASAVSDTWVRLYATAGTRTRTQMPYALCLMPYALRLTPYALCHTY